MNLGPLLRFLILTIGISVVALGERPTKESARVFVEKWVVSFNENAPDKMAAFYDKSKELELIVSKGLRIQGYAEVVKVYEEAKEEVRFRDSRAEKIAVRVFDETAVVSFEHRFKFKALHGGAQVRGHIRTTVTLRWVEGKWRIVMEHSSPIHGIDRYTEIVD